MFLKIGLGALAAVALTNPAMANETATATQITGVIDAAQAAPTGDREFAELFASWRSMDRTGFATPAPMGSVNVPSRSPLDAAYLSSGFGMRTHPVLGGRRNHKGIDLAQPSGTPVYATADGVIGKAEWFSSYGNYIQIEHGGEMETRYAHLSGYAVTFAGRRYDCGSKAGFIEATLAIALEREDLGPAVRRIAERLLAQ